MAGPEYSLEIVNHQNKALCEKKLCKDREEVLKEVAKYILSLEIKVGDVLNGSLVITTIQLETGDTYAVNPFQIILEPVMTKL